jgi:hypothetical protein
MIMHRLDSCGSPHEALDLRLSVLANEKCARSNAKRKLIGPRRVPLQSQVVVADEVRGADPVRQVLSNQAGEPLIRCLDLSRAVSFY